MKKGGQALTNTNHRTKGMIKRVVNPTKGKIKRWSILPKQHQPKRKEPSCIVDLFVKAVPLDIGEYELCRETHASTP